MGIYTVVPAIVLMLVFRARGNSWPRSLGLGVAVWFVAFVALGVLDTIGAV